MPIGSVRTKTKGIGRMLHELIGSRPRRCVRSHSVAASTLTHAALIVAVLAGTRGTGSDAHGRERTNQQTPSVVELRYFSSALPTGLVSSPASAAAKDLRESGLGAGKHAEPPRSGRFASLGAPTHAIADRLADIRPAFDVASLMLGLARD